MENSKYDIKTRIKICLAKGINFLPFGDCNDSNNITEIMAEILKNEDLVKQLEELDDSFWDKVRKSGLLIYYDNASKTENGKEKCLVGKFQSFSHENEFITVDGTIIMLEPGKEIPALALEKQRYKTMNMR